MATLMRFCGDGTLWPVRTGSGRGRFERLALHIPAAVSSFRPPGYDRGAVPFGGFASGGGELGAVEGPAHAGYRGRIRGVLYAAASEPASPRVGQAWGCENVGDFLCGFFVGEMVGSALGAFQSAHGREPTAGEHMEIVELVEGHSAEIRGFFARFDPG